MFILQNTLTPKTRDKQFNIFNKSTHMKIKVENGCKGIHLVLAVKWTELNKHFYAFSASLSVKPLQQLACKSMYVHVS